jgi:hypothetical protein
MSTAILPDDSVVVRMPTHTVHVDATARAIHVREPSHTNQLGGIIRASFPLESADRIRLMTARTGKQHLCLDLSSGETLDLGEVPSPEVAMVTARAIADLTRCKIEVTQGTVARLPGPSLRFTEGETYAAGASEQRASLAISPEHAEQMFQVIEALMDSQDNLQHPMPPEKNQDPVLVPGDSRTVEMTREEAERAMARARAKSLLEERAAPKVIPSDLEEDESDRPTITPRGSSRYTDGDRSTDRERLLDELGVDGLAATIADAKIDDLILEPPHAEWPSREDSAASTQPDAPVPQELVDEFVEETELDSDVLKPREPVFQQLLMESQLAAAMSPVAGERPTDLHVAARPKQTKKQAVLEMLRATVESLPEATSSMAEE